MSHAGGTALNFVAYKCNERHGSLMARFCERLLVVGGRLRLRGSHRREYTILPQRHWTRQMQNIVSHCVQDQFGYRVESEFSHYVISMSFCGLHRYPQDCCHVLRSTALPDHLHDLSLPWRQSRLHSSVLIVPPCTQVPVRDQVSYLGGEECTLTTQGFHCRNQIVRPIGLQYPTPNTHRQTLTNHFLGLDVSQNHYSLCWVKLQDLTCGFRAVQFGHADV